METRKILLYLALKYDGDFDKIFAAISNKDAIDEKEAEKTIQKVNSKFITIMDDEYPDNLKRVFKPPFVIFYHGDISLIKDSKKNLAVVGSRENSNYGGETTEYFVKGLCKDFVIISGMARGIDAIAHRAAIENGGKTVAVLGQGINVNYLRQNDDIYENCKKHHLVISEYPDEVQPSPRHFPIRNRIIAGLCDSLLVTEGKMNSGTQITAMLMAEKDGNVCCVPTHIGENSLCNHLISNGAFLVETVSDVFEVVGVQPKTAIFEK